MSGALDQILQTGTDAGHYMENDGVGFQLLPFSASCFYFMI